MQTVYSTYAGGSLPLVIVPPSYNLRWPAIVARFSAENSNATLEICQDHFAAVTHAIFDLRSKHNYQRTPEEDLLYCRKCDPGPFLTPSFERSLMKSHRALKDIIFQTSSLLDDAERELEGQIDDINALINRIGNVEPSEGPGRYDNLDSVLTIAKGWSVKPRSLPESPVYLKRTAGVSLRSARFDNKVRAGEAGCR